MSEASACSIQQGFGSACLIEYDCLKVVDPGYVQMSHGLGPTKKLRVTERVQWKWTVIVRWWCWWKSYGNLWAVPDLCLEFIGTEPSLSDTNSGFLKDPAAVAIVIANPVPVDLVSGFPNYKLHKTNEPYGTHFPIISIFDMVRAQFKLLDHLGISKLFVSVGSNMGGMQSIVTAWLEPQRVQRVVRISGCGRTGPSSIALQYAQWSALLLIIAINPIVISSERASQPLPSPTFNIPKKDFQAWSGMSDKSISVSTKY
ncbi:Alpha/Beta hydrolase protein [Phakopsora pachyrhizi]|nr:Alpha/Beta hydrolase protein [Phakopsora pachyrhizi]